MAKSITIESERVIADIRKAASESADRLKFVLEKELEWHIKYVNPNVSQLAVRQAFADLFIGLKGDARKAIEFHTEELERTEAYLAECHETIKRNTETCGLWDRAIDVAMGTS